MSEPKPTNPLVVVLLIVGIIGAVGFTLYRALAPVQTPKAPDTVASSQTATPAEAAPAAPADTQATPQAQGEQAAQPRTQRRSLVGENEALGVNPFKPTAQNGAALRPAPTRPAAPTQAPSTGPLPAPLLVSQDRAARSQALNALAASDRRLPAPSAPGTPSTQPMPVTVEPELVGTMLGGRPTAVFRADKTMLMVPQGGVYLGWRVMKVGHSEATVWNGGVQLRLRVGMPATPVASTAQSPPPLSTGQAASNFVIVHYKSRPAPTRQDLVYGRIEDPALYGAGEPDPASDTSLPPEPGDPTDVHVGNGGEPEGEPPPVEEP